MRTWRFVEEGSWQGGSGEGGKWVLIVVILGGGGGGGREEEGEEEEEEEGEESGGRQRGRKKRRRRRRRKRAEESGRGGVDILGVGTDGGVWRWVLVGIGGREWALIGREWALTSGSKSKGVL